MKAPEKISEIFPATEVMLNEKQVKNLGVIKSLKISKRIHFLLNKVRIGYKCKFEKTMTAITFAEVGEFDIAKDILSNNKKMKEPNAIIQTKLNVLLTKLII